MSGFVDECNLNVRGGDGGAGAVSFRREAFVPKGGPDGGDGGNGGDVWLVADHNVASLLAFRDHPHRRAPNGTHGSGKARHGSSGADVTVTVPEGTSIFDFDGSCSPEVKTIEGSASEVISAPRGVVEQVPEVVLLDGSAGAR